MSFDFKPGIPIYTQIVEYMQLQIASGKYAPGEKIPSVRELALEASVNPNTMQRALSELERDGLLYTVRTSGRFVTDFDETLNHLKKTMAEKSIGELFLKLDALGIDRIDSMKLITEWNNREEK
ncbi:MAG: GntR family transcriptional regulator [Anaerovoracaceae bacterium]